mmetsp:Transcript_224/g.610  ORF Transcript_224/g.610 Transcript_224/m.610 type:complete len:210 (-) Transcript_224:77-706(-)
MLAKAYGITGCPSSPIRVSPVTRVSRHIGALSCPRSSPFGFAAVMTLAYVRPSRMNARISCIRADSSLTLPVHVLPAVNVGTPRSSSATAPIGLISSSLAGPKMPAPVISLGAAPASTVSCIDTTTDLASGATCTTTKPCISVHAPAQVIPPGTTLSALIHAAKVAHVPETAGRAHSASTRAAVSRPPEPLGRGAPARTMEALGDASDQ